MLKNIVNDDEVTNTANAVTLIMDAVRSVVVDEILPSDDIASLSSYITNALGVVNRIYINEVK